MHSRRPVQMLRRSRPEPPCVRGDWGLDAGLAKPTGTPILWHKWAWISPWGPAQRPHHGADPDQLNPLAAGESFKWAVAIPIL